MRMFFFALALVASSTLSPAHARDQVQTYTQGQRLSFTRAAHRFVCRQDRPIVDFVRYVKDTFPDDAVGILFKPLEPDWSGNAKFSANLRRQLPQTTAALYRACKPAPDELVVIGALEYIQVTDHDDVAITLVIDHDRKVWFTYFLNIRVTMPMPGTPASQHFARVLEVMIQNNTITTSPR